MGVGFLQKKKKKKGTTREGGEEKSSLFFSLSFICARASARGKKERGEREISS